LFIPLKLLFSFSLAKTILCCYSVLDFTLQFTIPRAFMEESSNFYNHFAEGFEKIPFSKILPDLILKHRTILQHNRVLDVGAGTGTLAQWMQGEGLEILCLDPSEEMVRRCKKKGLNTTMGTIQDFHSEEKFSGVMAISSLIHVPKRELPLAFEKIYSLLDRKGLCFLSFIVGKGEAWEDPLKQGTQRFFSFLSTKDVHKLIGGIFTVLEEENIFVERMQKNFVLLVLEKND
jgi:2-polyprenyl-3-methyl-5-hydroxy-6-metoxy-1,4-benzoquinol methylase